MEKHPEQRRRKRAPSQNILLHMHSVGADARQQEGPRPTILRQQQPDAKNVKMPRECRLHQEERTTFS
eukprot:1266166-Pyramimonas_sp.AAC.1